MVLVLVLSGKWSSAQILTMVLVPSGVLLKFSLMELLSWPQVEYCSNFQLWFWSLTVICSNLQQEDAETTPMYVYQLAKDFYCDDMWLLSVFIMSYLINDFIGYVHFRVLRFVKTLELIMLQIMFVEEYFVQWPYKLCYYIANNFPFHLVKTTCKYDN